MADHGGGISAGVAMFGMLMTVATIAIVLSQRANTTAVLKALGTSTGGVIGAAIAPVTGGGNNGPPASPAGSG